MYDLILYRLPLTMVIAIASRNTVQKCHPQRQHHKTLLQLYVDIIIIISNAYTLCFLEGSLEQYLRKRIGASIYCVIPQLGDFRYSDLMRLSSIF